jgi:hypothetical protein
MMAKGGESIRLPTDEVLRKISNGKISLMTTNERESEERAPVQLSLGSWVLQHASAERRGVGEVHLRTIGWLTPSTIGWCALPVAFSIS